MARRFGLRWTAAVTVVGILVAGGLFTYGAWQRRWTADDGLIVMRTVRNLYAGNGPVFNKGERVEVNTSAAWTYVMWLFGWIARVRLEYVALGLCLVLSTAAIVFVMLGSGRLLRHRRGVAGAGSVILLPAGVFVYTALPPARDFATSGLEVGLLLCWLGALWWLLVRWATTARPSTGSVLFLGFLAGLSWLVRPETVLVGGPVLLLLFCARQSWRRRIALVLVSGVLPIGYQIWRMGYYALPYPNTAVAKDAAEAKWGQGVTYMADLVLPYLLWVPLILLVVVAAAMLYWPGRARALRDRVMASRNDGAGYGDTTGARADAPHEAEDPAHAAVYRPPRRHGRSVASRWSAVQEWLHSPTAVVTLILAVAVVWLLYELRVGGDFMHGRVLLPVVFLLCAPLAMIPVRLPTRNAMRAFVPSAVSLLAWIGVIAWALSIVNVPGLARPGIVTRDGIVDERAFYVAGTGNAHPVTADDYLDFPRMHAMVDTIRATPQGGMLLPNSVLDSWTVVPPKTPPPPGEEQHTIYFLNLGMPSMNTSLDVKTYDQVGLAFPTAAHTPRIEHGRIGHDKNLPSDWLVAMLGLADEHADGLPLWMDEDWVTEAQTALTCPNTEYLIQSYTADLTLARWWENFKHAWNLASYQIDPVPEYEIARCGLVPPVLNNPHDR